MNEQQFMNIIKMLNLGETEEYDEIILRKQNPDQSNYTFCMNGDDQNDKNVTKMLGAFILTFIKKKAKEETSMSPYFIDILMKISKKLKDFKDNEEYQEYLNWTEKLSYSKFNNWVTKIKSNFTPNKTISFSLKNFQQIFGLCLIESESFKKKHYQVVLKRIVKHVLLYEFTRNLIKNSIDEKSKQQWNNAVTYISRLSKFLRGFKKPQELTNLKDK